MMLKRIIVIDDEPHYRELIKEFSSLISVECMSFAQWSDEIIEYADKNTLLFLDIHMPNQDGIDTLMELNRLRIEAGVVILSGAEEGVVASVMKLGEVMHLTMLGQLNKPFSIQRFKEKVAAFQADKRKYADTQLKLGALEITEQELTEFFEKGWFYPVYQPQIAPKTQTIFGVECLARLDHPDLGPISPLSFIDDLIRLELIDQFTLLLIEKALTELGPYLKKNRHVAISFNVSAMSLNRTFTSNTINLCQELGVSSGQITIEITETKAITLSEEALYSVSKLRAAKFNLSVDDFGTGHSTMMQLHELPFNELKIDRSFISKITLSSAALKIVEATIKMAQSLSFNVVVEGIETQTQLDLVSALGNCYVQGYIYSKPIPAQEFVEFSNALQGL
ncbi:signal transduction protein [Pseudoalteromonas sp. A25]|uniref:EAL domain-containing response regulator n=1 Tax=Pseudoalteromonas sp. A25 TaxID=116092 RepID=UPI001260C95B|nr:EAL domain-containing response regulator [Pseudoalteromonas sp. A25]BBN83540.1 signal transduction protein [Pseudoalteromonas sp. A25]